MAIQNFLNGGFYGKLGDTIGERWKNKRTIKSYAVPSNPRTPKQMANRKTFGDAVPLAQFAKMCDQNSLMFTVSNNTTWALLMQEAKRKTDSGETGLNRLPICMNDFLPQYFIETIQIGKSETTDGKALFFSGVLPSENQTLCIVWQKESASPTVENTFLFYVEFNAETKSAELEDTIAELLEIDCPILAFTFTPSITEKENFIFCSEKSLQQLGKTEVIITSENLRLVQSATEKKLYFTEYKISDLEGIFSLSVTSNSLGLESTAEISASEFASDDSGSYAIFHTPNENSLDYLSSWVSSGEVVTLSSVSVESKNFEVTTDGASVNGENVICSDVATLRAEEMDGYSFACSVLPWNVSEIPTISAKVKIQSNRLFGQPPEDIWDEYDLETVSEFSAGNEIQLRISADEQFAAYSDWCVFNSEFSFTDDFGITRTASSNGNLNFSNQVLITYVDTPFTSDVCTLDGFDNSSVSQFPKAEIHFNLWGDSSQTIDNGYFMCYKKGGSLTNFYKDKAYGSANFYAYLETNDGDSVDYGMYGLPENQNSSQNKMPLILSYPNIVNDYGGNEENDPEWFKQYSAWPGDVEPLIDCYNFFYYQNKGYVAFSNHADLTDMSDLSPEKRLWLSSENNDISSPLLKLIGFVG